MKRHQIPLRLLFLEPFFGGSHQAFALGLKAHSSHDIQILALPAMYWKWRMSGAAFEFLRRIRDLDAYDGIIATDMMNVGDFILHANGKAPPVLLYFHENQFTYPVSEHERTAHFPGSVNLSSALAAKRVLFNSHYHYHAFFDGVERFLEKIPDMELSWIIDRIRAKSDVLYPGCRLEPPEEKTGKGIVKTAGPLVIWNHRWEYDKNPADFFVALKIIQQKKIPFSLALLGERFDDNIPDAFSDAKDTFRDQLSVYDFVASRKDYFSWLRKGRVVVSTSWQENFGISIIEAVSAGCIPLVPNRLSYPEIIPEPFHEICLYNSQKEMITKLETLLQHPGNYGELSINLSKAMERYSWETLSKEYDKHLEALINF